MRNLTLILIVFFGLALSSCKEEEKEHFMFLKFLLQAEKPEEFLKSSSYFDSTCTDCKINLKTINWFSQAAKEEGFNILRFKNKGVRLTKCDYSERKVHEIHFGHKESNFLSVIIIFKQNNECEWKLFRFAAIGE